MKQYSKSSLRILSMPIAPWTKAQKWTTISWQETLKHKVEKNTQIHKENIDKLLKNIICKTILYKYKKKQTKKHIMKNFPWTLSWLKKKKKMDTYWYQMLLSFTILCLEDITVIFIY